MPDVSLTPRPTDGLVERLGYPRQADLWKPMSMDYDVFEDKFWGDAILGLYPSAKTNGTSAAVTFTEHNAGGYLDLVSGTADDGYAGQGMGLQFKGDRGMLAEFIVRTPAAVTTMKFEVGLSDADDDAGAVNVKATPNATAADYGVFVFDRDDDTVLAFHSAKAGTITASEDTGITVAADTTYRLAVRVTDDNLVAYVNGVVVAEHGNGIEGGSALTPWVFCQARAGSASRTLQLHKWRVTAPAY